LNSPRKNEEEKAMVNRIGIIIQNKKFLPLCLLGMKYLAEEQAKDNISVPWGVEIADKNGVLRTLMSLRISDVWIIGSDTNEPIIAAQDLLRNVLHSRTPIIGVAIHHRDSDFLEACQLAANGDFLQPNIALAPPPDRRSLDEAIAAAEEMLAKKF
jgi:hypothetical protein